MMFSDLFTTTEHTIDCSHIREYPRATASDQLGVLSLAVKQYTPRCNPDPKPGDVTIIATHGSGLPKELYEPLWEELLIASETYKFGIRAIWIADISHQGQSGIMNEEKLGNDASWFDHCRDLLHMVNIFRDQMPRPLVGVGHSMGAVQLILLSLMHPRLLAGMILYDPIMERSIERCHGSKFTKYSTFRRDSWPTIEEARSGSKKNQRSWDPRVHELWCKYGLRELHGPILAHSQYSSEHEQVSQRSSSEQASKQSRLEKQRTVATSDGWDMDKWFKGHERPLSTRQRSVPVTLTTTKHQEVFSYLRFIYNGLTPSQTFPTIPNQTDGADPTTSDLVEVDRLLHPDLVGSPEQCTPFYHTEPIIAHLALPHVRPSVLYVFGEISPVSVPAMRKDKVTRTGTGWGGNGGVKRGRVGEVVIPGRSHLAPLESVKECSIAAARWLEVETQRWTRDEERFVHGWADKSLTEKTTLGGELVAKIKAML